MFASFLFLRKDEKYVYLQHVLKNNNGLERLDKEPSGVDNIEIMTGPSTNNNGKSGFVSPPVSADKEKYLKDNGMWI